MADVSSINTGALESIADPHTRSVLKQLVSGWQLRNGQSGNGDKAFLTEADLKDSFKKSAIVNAIGDALKSSPRKVNDRYTPIGQLITDMQSEILADPFFQFLGERIKLINIPVTQLVNDMIGVKDGIYQVDQKVEDAENGIYSVLQGVGLRVGGATAGYASLNELKADAVSASAAMTEQVRVALNNKIEAGDQQERNYRVQSDNAMASAINIMWAAMGDGTALVQTGSETVANRTGAIARSWQQVQAALTDPVTNQLYTSIVGRTEFNITASKVTGLSGKYTVKLDANGYVVGYGLASEVDINGKKSSKFYIRADKFAIGTPNDTVDPVTGESPGAKVPFIVTTVDTIVNGRHAPAGVYMDRAFIRNGSIDSLAVGDAQIDTAHIKTLSVDTARIKNNAITVPLVSTSYAVTSGAGNNNFLVVCTAVINLDFPGMVFATSTGYISYGTGWRFCETRLRINGAIVASGGGFEAWVNATHSNGKHCDAGTVIVELLFAGADTGVRITNATLFVQAAYK